MELIEAIRKESKMKIEIEITEEQLQAITEWRELVIPTKKDFERRIYPEDHDFSYSAPEILQEQEMLKSRAKAMGHLIDLANEIIGK